jgi:hypothetical protein
MNLMTSSLLLTEPDHQPHAVLLSSNQPLAADLETLFEGLDMNLAQVVQTALNERRDVLQWARAVSLGCLIHKINSATTPQERQPWISRLVALLSAHAQENVPMTRLSLQNALKARLRSNPSSARFYNSQQITRLVEFLNQLPEKNRAGALEVVTLLLDEKTPEEVISYFVNNHRAGLEKYYLQAFKRIQQPTAAQLADLSMEDVLSVTAEIWSLERAIAYSEAALDSSTLSASPWRHEKNYSRLLEDIRNGKLPLNRSLGILQVRADIAQGAYKNKPGALQFFEAMLPRVMDAYLGSPKVLEEALNRIPDAWLGFFVQWGIKNPSIKGNIDSFLDFCGEVEKSTVQASLTDPWIRSAANDDRAAYFESLFSLPHGPDALKRFLQLPESVRVFRSDTSQTLEVMQRHDFERAGPLKLVATDNGFLWIGPTQLPGQSTVFSQAAASWTVSRIGAGLGAKNFALAWSTPTTAVRVYLQAPGTTEWVAATSWNKRSQKVMQRWYSSVISDPQPSLENRVLLPAGTQVHLQTEDGKPGVFFTLPKQ